jgi:hypothetical protein
MWAWGFVAGFALAAWVILSTHFAGAQSPEVAGAIQRAAAAYGASEGQLLRVAWCESRYRPGVDNAQGSGARGLFQFMDRTWVWMSWQAGWGGANPYDPEAAAHVAAWAFSRGYGPAHWRACW